MSEQIDIAVNLGALPPPLPDILTLRQLVELAPATPPLLIGGILHQGCKLILGGTSRLSMRGSNSCATRACPPVSRARGASV